jgi:hypothetical protein
VSTQPQLLQIALDRKDVVYTPDWVARDMVEFFKPSGRILEPSCGDGAFLKYLPGADWCEIEKGRDFFACQEKYDWIVGNPPYKIFTKWLEHSLALGENIVYLQIISSVFISYKRHKSIFAWGGIKHLRTYSGDVFDIPISFNIGAFHFQRGYTGPMYTSFYEGDK